MRISLHNKGFGKINEGDYEKELAGTEIPSSGAKCSGDRGSLTPQIRLYTQNMDIMSHFPTVCFFWGFNDEHRLI